ncbi:MAG: glutamine--tRNA ligase/YqeY domain fusion protein, partial [Trueperaceae bacterium]
YRGRSVEENLDLFARMKEGEFGPGEVVLRAKIDMAHPNMKMRDPILYRVVDAEHYRTGSEWPIYPMYDFAHPLSDAIEGITHSLCTLEFENNRAVYDWLIERLVPTAEEQPHQYEFARLQLDYTVVSKRKLLRLVREGVVTGWDDPRMPTISALRRRGVTPEAIREFANRVGVAKANSRTDLALLDSAIRDDLNTRAPRVMAVLEPLRVTLTNVEPGEHLEVTAPYWPPDVPGEGVRAVPLTRDLVIERSDFELEPPAGFKRLAPGRAVRLRHAFVIRCDEVVTDDAGNVVELKCHAYRDSVGESPAGVKVWAALHWVSESAGLPFTARLYEPLFTVRDPDGAEGDLLDYVNPDALREVHGLIEPSVAQDAPDTRYQFERQGYFWRDPVDGREPLDLESAGARGVPLVFNRIVGLKDAWARKTAAEGSARQDSVSTDGLRKGAGSKRTELPAGTEPRAQAEQSNLGAVLEQLTAAQRARYDELTAAHGLPETDALTLTTRVALDDLYTATVAEGAASTSAANWVLNDLAGYVGQEGFALTGQSLASLIGLVDGGSITSRVAKELLPDLLAGADPVALVKERGLERLDDEQAVREQVAAVVAAHPDELAAYRGGKSGLRGFFVGQVMRATGGRADPKLVQSLVEQALEA